jgi:excisionase family DNA binding protein
MTENLALMDIEHRARPAAFHELAAARYVGLCRPYFRDLVMSGAIPYRQHLGRPTRIYLKADLDAYLMSLEKRIMPSRENPLVALKEAK